MYVCKQTFHKLYGQVIEEFLENRMWNSQVGRNTCFSSFLIIKTILDALWWLKHSCFNVDLLGYTNLMNFFHITKAEVNMIMVILIYQYY